MRVNENKYKVIVYNDLHEKDYFLFKVDDIISVMFNTSPLLI